MATDFHAAPTSAVYGRNRPAEHNVDLQVLRRIRRFLLPKDFAVSAALIDELNQGYGLNDAPVDSLLADGIKFARPLQRLILRESGFADNAPTTAQNRADDQSLLKRAEFAELYAQFATYPDWYEPQLAEIGAVAYRRYPLMLVWLLRNVALMAGYSIPALALPLIQTGALVNDALPRLMRTYAYILAVSEHAAVSPTGRTALAIGSEGWRQSIQVRQIHGLVRKQLRHNGWDSTYWGIPINQTDMVATHLQFSLLIMRGLKILGARISTEEAEGILHLWQLASWWMGIELARLPQHETAAWAWLYTYLATQELDFEVGKPLAKALHDLPSQLMGKQTRRGRWVEMVNASVTRTLVGDDIGDGLGLPRPKWRIGILASVPILFGVDTARQFSPQLAIKLEQVRAKRQDNMNWWLKRYDHYYQ